MRRFLALFGCALLWTGAPGALGAPKKKPAPSIPWTRTIEEAKQAGNSEKPIVILLVQDHCKLSKDLEANLVADDRLAGLVEKFAWLKIVVGSSAYLQWFAKECGSRVEGTPSLLFLSPKGEGADSNYVSLPVVTSSDPDDLFPALRSAAQCAKGGAIAEPDKARILEAQKVPAADHPAAEVIRAREAVIRYGEGWTSERDVVDLAKKEIERLLREGSLQILEIQRKERDPQAAKEAYKALQQKYEGTVVAQWAAEECKTLEKAFGK